MKVLVRARVGVYERDGVYQLYVNGMQPEGAGALAVAFEQRKKRLAARGLFDEAHKKPLPPYPDRVGVVTSETGAALRDILSVLSRRYPCCTAVVAPALVQGETAADSIREALGQLDRQGRCDLIILGRGGGSAEDLWCFNDEALAQAVYDCETPVISAVGHETDFTICDLVADLRAPTPSAAAELAVPSLTELRARLGGLRERLRGQAQRSLEERALRVGLLRSRPVLQSPTAGIEKMQERLDFFGKALYNRRRIFIQAKAQDIRSRAALLDSLSPLRVLGRGYCVTYKDGEPVREARSLGAGDRILVRFHDGAAEAVVDSVREGQP